MSRPSGRQSPSPAVNCERALSDRATSHTGGVGSERRAALHSSSPAAAAPSCPLSLNMRPAASAGAGRLPPHHEDKPRARRKEGPPGREDRVLGELGRPPQGTEAVSSEGVRWRLRGLKVHLNDLSGYLRVPRVPLVLCE